MKISTLALMTSIAVAAIPAYAQEASFNADQTKQIQNIVHDYLVKNPEVLIEASMALQQKEQGKMVENAQKAIAPHAKALYDSNAPVAGNPKGKVNLVMFFDYQCIHCKESSPDVDNLIKANADLRVIYKEFPIFGKDSEFASRAALASVKQHKYQAFHDALMATKNPVNADAVFAAAKSVGLNVDELKKDMDSDAIKKELMDNRQLAQALGVNVTPIFIVGNMKNAAGSEFIPGAVGQENLQAAIDAFAKKS